MRLGKLKFCVETALWGQHKCDPGALQLLPWVGNAATSQPVHVPRILMLALIGPCLKRKKKSSA